MRRIFCFILAMLCYSITATASVNVDLSSQKITLGEPIKVTIVTKAPIKKYKIALNKKKFKLFLEERKKNKYTYSALIGIKRQAKAGSYKMAVDIVLKNKVRFYEDYKIVLAYKMPAKKGRVTLSKSKKKLSKNKSAYSTEQDLLSKKFSRISKQNYYKSKFTYPAKGRISSPFGRMRYYNNGNTSSHAGLDIANKKGTKVVAPQSGMVILSETLDIHGNTVMIDHGQGLVSIFCHLNKRTIFENKRVKKGQKIGEMGNTGVASGVHLHWGMSVQNVRVDPLFFLKNRYISK